MKEIIDSLKNIIPSSQEDEIIINGKATPIKKENFQPITPEQKTLAFVDGGQAQLFSAPNFSLDIIRIYAAIYQNKTKTKKIQKQFYLLTKTNENLEFQSEIFGDQIINKKDLQLNSLDPTLKQGTQRASIKQIANLARRFSELEICRQIAPEVDFVILDGNLEITSTNENKYLKQLPENVCSLTKTSTVFSKKGNSAAGILNEISPDTEWLYPAGKNNFFTKLNQHSHYVFHFQGSPKALNALIPLSNDPVFPGYPYPLIYVDKFARITNQEKEFLKTQLITKLGNDYNKLKKYISALDAHSILDNIS